MSAHLVIVAFFSLVFLCLCLFSFFFLRPENAPTTNETAGRYAIAGLSAANVPHVDLVFRDTDYRMLRTRPDLRPICVKLRRDRRRIALMWLGELQRDVRILWEFRRFLVRHGLPVTIGEEVAIGCGACFALFYLKTLRIIVFTSGPFVFSGALRSARVPVDRLSTKGSVLLARAPIALRTEIEQSWTQHVLRLSVGHPTYVA